MSIKSPIIHMSGAASEAVRQDAWDAGGAAFLNKPFAVPDLVRVIENVTQRGHLVHT
jgi:DNA-binding response OmpR family regulator